MVTQEHALATSMGAGIQRGQVSLRRALAQTLGRDLPSSPSCRPNSYRWKRAKCRWT